ncbi:hypothetical protein FVR03_01855 [Pontibacter qinzhouensis]|uniref:Uncharacterized protein n=1 Tax=Pontibacter qinzhouensis TaxID=2603253 RepID=A0A5C8KCH2_9BACT|nr:hypothetical protein [Pontibacter qinzhouensis]TXK52189.1 hypothetical protein FVR03_01855 [Pontibacter qinzhouensis]
MDNLILIHCILLLVIVLVVLLVFVWGEPSQPGKTHFKIEKWLLACSSLAGFVILHLNWLFLPAYIQKFGDPVSFAFFLVLATFCVAPLFFLAKKHKPAKKNPSWSVFINANQVHSPE